VSVPPEIRSDGLPLVTLDIEGIEDRPIGTPGTSTGAAGVRVEIRKPSLSPTALSEYEICGRRGQYYHDPDIPRGTGLGLLKGGAWHHGLEAFNRARLYYGDLHVAIIEPDELYERLYHLMIGHLWEGIYAPDGQYQPDFVPPFTPADGEGWEEQNQAAIDAAVYDLATMAKTYALMPAANRWMGDGYQVEAVEQMVLTEFGSEYHQMHGVIDVVINSKRYGPIPVDYKSAGKKWSGPKAKGDPRRLIQAPLYAEAWTRITGEQVNWFAYDVMQVNGKFERYFVDVSPEVRAPFVKRWNNVSAQIQMHKEAGIDHPHNPSSFLCDPRWCGFWPICDMGAGLEQAMKREKREQ
jgi:hypothetical protein